MIFPCDSRTVSFAILVIMKINYFYVMDVIEVTIPTALNLKWKTFLMETGKFCAKEEK